MAQMMVFVSHSHEDDAFCRAVVAGLIDAGANVWYDEHNMQAGHLMEVIQRELGRRPVVVVILTKAAFASRWVKREIGWAYELMDRDPARLLLPVTAGPIARDDFSPQDGWLFLSEFKRIEAAGYQPYPTAEAVRRLLHALALTPAGEAPAPTTARPSESAADLLERGKALTAQQRYAEALPLFERATQLTPTSFEAWADLGYVLNMLKRYAEALPALDRALALDSSSAAAWNNKGNALSDLKRPAEALAAYDRALALDPAYANAWTGKGNALYDLKRYAEALAAYDRALALDPANAVAWNNKGNALSDLMRNEEALAAYDRALALDPAYAFAWNNKGAALHDLKRYEEALAAYERALALDPAFAVAWSNKGNALRDLKRYEEALAAYDRALALDPASAVAWYNKGLTLEELKRYGEALDAYDRGFDRNDPMDWRAHARVYRALGRTAEAEAAERRAKELGG
ncbi:MAG TPA: tetratricopeptide repeat protein [Ktedonobacterales bacterium]|nr:tetratricopeptide repeat protein [Ktedonobacterales bacterium]